MSRWWGIPILVLFVWIVVAAVADWSDEKKGNEGERADYIVNAAIIVAVSGTLLISLGMSILVHGR